MKKKLLYYLFTVLGAVTVFTSCSNDDEQPSTPSSGLQELAGEYKGNLEVTLVTGEGDEPTTVEGQVVTVIPNGESAVDLKISDFAFGPMELGDIELTGCPVRQEADSYTFTGKTSLHLDGLTADVDAAGSIANSVLKIDLDIDHIAIESVTVPYTVKAVYEGTKTSGENGVEGKEAKILAFTFDKEEAANAIVVSEPEIDEEKKTVSFLYAGEATAEQLAALVPTVQVSEGATVNPASGVAQDFSKEVVYTVTSGDGQTTAVYTVTASKQVITGNVTYDFTTWVAETHAPILGDTKEYLIPEGWKTSNPGIVEMGKYADELGNPDWSVKKEDADAEGVALVQTQNTVGKDMWISKIPTITAGSLYLGTWKTNMTNTLNSTKFGVQYDNAQGKPVQVKVRYKYESGKDYYTCPAGSIHKGTVDTSRGEYADQFSIKVSLYTTNGYDEDKFSDYLTGEAGEANFYTSSRVVSKGELVEGSTEGAWKEATVNLNEFELDAAQKYRFTIVCSSSYEGDKFYGAPGSKLWIDKIEIVYQK